MINEEAMALPITMQRESIELTKNSRGYNWSIKILEINIERLEKLNNEMLTKFGGLKE